jgi:hypothetical protein
VGWQATFLSLPWAKVHVSGLLDEILADAKPVNTAYLGKILRNLPRYGPVLANFSHDFA